ncbi:hypothetical protein [Bradyrhizobium sp. 2TAF24]|uniref:hypothetical protein n=1 Tax=Bradyrhizobium sp. 2TAF24 TaxID=3233011 RepID=UPI003F90F5DF
MRVPPQPQIMPSTKQTSQRPTSLKGCEDPLPAAQQPARAGRTDRAATRGKTQGDRQAFMRFVKAARKVGLLVSRETYDRYYKDTPPAAEAGGKASGNQA